MTGPERAKIGCKAKQPPEGDCLYSMFDSGSWLWINPAVSASHTVRFHHECNIPARWGYQSWSLQ